MEKMDGSCCAPGRGAFASAMSPVVAASSTPAADAPDEPTAQAPAPAEHA